MGGLFLAQLTVVADVGWRGKWANLVAASNRQGDGRRKIEIDESHVYEIYRSLKLEQKSTTESVVIGAIGVTGILNDHEVALRVTVGKRSAGF